MALKACKECGKEVSTTATKCPNCGVRNPTITGKDVLAGLVVFFGICIALSMLISVADTSSNAPPKDPRAAAIEKSFSVWDGSHRKLVDRVKSSMNDPDSFEHIDTRYKDNGDDTLFVIMEFTGANAFGGRVRNAVRAKTSVSTGEVLEILSYDD